LPLRGIARLVLCLLLLAALLMPQHHIAHAQTPHTQLTLPAPAGSVRFGEKFLVLPNGNFLVADSRWGNEKGAVYLYNGKTLEIISRLHGNAKGNNVGSGLRLLENGNFVVTSINWLNYDNISPAGAVTWGDADTGFIGGGGAISPENSLVGARSGDLADVAIVPLTNGNFLVAAPGWDHDNVVDLGAVLWANGETGVVGYISSENSLIGASTNDRVGMPSPVALSNGNYVVQASSWDNGDARNAGAVVWGDGAVGSHGVVSAENALVGTSDLDEVGLRTIPLSNGNYLVVSPSWDRGPFTDAGAVTWGSGTSGIVGAVSRENSFVGSQILAGRDLYLGLKTLPNGNYVIHNPFWDYGSMIDVGAMTWADGTKGIVGEATLENSLIGSSDQDRIGFSFTLLENGNFVVYSPYWSSEKGTNASAATWVNATTGITGTVSAANSLVGEQPTYVSIANKVIPLTNGDYVVANPTWSSAETPWLGAVTWGDGEAGTVGVITTTNSLVGATNSDSVGYVTVLTNGNYVISSPLWDNGLDENTGAVTFGNGEGGTVGVISAANSLIGALPGRGMKQLVTPLENGNFVVQTGVASDDLGLFSGYLTVVNGTAPTTGIIDDANSLKGENPDYLLGYSTLIPLTNGNFVAQFPYVDAAVNGTLLPFMLATAWIQGAPQSTGTVGESQSVMSFPSDLELNLDKVIPLADGNYLAYHPYWSSTDGGVIGALRWGDGSAPAAGELGAHNSLVGLTPDRISGATGPIELASGDYLYQNNRWKNGEMLDAGAITYVAGGDAVVGNLSAGNSIVGARAYSGNGMTHVHNPVHNYLLVSFPNENRVIVASFAKHDVTAAVDGEGAGMVLAHAGGIVCGATCTETYPAGLEVRLEALPGPYSTFAGWGGDCTGVTEPVCALSIDAAKSVSATFDKSDEPGSQTSLLPFVEGSGQ